MRTFMLLAAIGVLGVLSPGWAVDYGKIERVLRKEPAYEKTPKYALLLFGKEAKLRVWAAVAGEVLYLDRNGDGDLTGKDERFARLDDCKDIEIPDPDGKTRYLIQHLSVYKDKEGRESLSVDVEIKGPLAYRQYCGVDLVQPAAKAKVAHFHGPLTVGPLLSS
jgi:hypothetical protein